MNNLQKSLQDRAKEFSVVLPFMENRDKGTLEGLYNIRCTINEYGFLKDENGSEYVVFTIKEDDGNFFFGGLVLTENIKQLDEEGYQEEIFTNGLPIKLTKKKSKNKREYTNVEYYPEE